jgi:hypothetical protein
MIVIIIFTSTDKRFSSKCLFHLGHYDRRKQRDARCNHLCTIHETRTGNGLALNNNRCTIIFVSTTHLSN